MVTYTMQVITNSQITLEDILTHPLDTQIMMIITSHLSQSQTNFYIKLKINFYTIYNNILSIIHFHIIKISIYIYIYSFKTFSFIVLNSLYDI